MGGQHLTLAKRRGRPATGQGVTIGVRMHNDLLGAVDRWMQEEAALGRPMTRSEAVRRLVAEALEKMGLKEPGE